MLGLLTSRRKARAKLNEQLASLTSGEEGEILYKPIEWPLVRRLLQLLRPFWKQYALGVALGVLAVIADMMSPQFMRWIINYIEARGKDISDSAAIWHVAMIVGFLAG